MSSTLLVFLVISLCKFELFFSSSSNWDALIFPVRFFFLMLTTSPWWTSQSMLPSTDFLFLPANWISFDGPDSTSMLPSDFDLLFSFLSFVWYYQSYLQFIWFFLSISFIWHYHINVSYVQSFTDGHISYQFHEIFHLALLCNCLSDPKGVKPLGTECVHLTLPPHIFSVQVKSRSMLHHFSFLELVHILFIIWRGNVS